MVAWIIEPSGALPEEKLEQNQAQPKGQLGSGKMRKQKAKESPKRIDGANHREDTAPDCQIVSLVKWVDQKRCCLRECDTHRRPHYGLEECSHDPSD
jgi:hypothetical protein